MWDDYEFPCGRLNENLLGQKSVRDDPYGSNFKNSRKE